MIVTANYKKYLVMTVELDLRKFMIAGEYDRKEKALQECGEGQMVVEIAEECRKSRHQNCPIVIKFDQQKKERVLH